MKISSKKDDLIRESEFLEGCGKIFNDRRFSLVAKCTKLELEDQRNQLTLVSSDLRPSLEWRVRDFARNYVRMWTTFIRGESRSSFVQQNETLIRAYKSEIEDLKNKVERSMKLGSEKCADSYLLEDEN